MNLSKFWIIVREVYRKNVKSAGFIFMVLGPIITFAIFGAVGYYINKSETGKKVVNIAVLNADEETRKVLTENASESVLHFDYDENKAKEEMNSDKIDGYLIINKDGQGNFNPIYYRKTTSKDVNLESLKSGLEKVQGNNLAKSLGLQEEGLKKLKDNNVKISTINLSKDEKGNLKEANADDPVNFLKQALAYIVCIIVFTFIANYISIISQEIATEKGSRIMEIVLSSVSATTHFAGKMVGILFVILTQLVIYFGLYKVVIFFFNKYNLLKSLSIPGLDMLFKTFGTEIWTSFLYAFLGILIYTAIAGFLGSLVSKTEDVAKMTSPIIFTALIGFYIGMFALTSTNNPVVRITSHIPFFTPFIMPFRMAAGTVSSLEITISVIISIVFTVLCLLLAAVFYKSNVLTYSDKGLINNFRRSLVLWKEERKSQAEKAALMKKNR